MTVFSAKSLFISLLSLFISFSTCAATSDKSISKSKITWLVEDKLENIDLLAKESADSSTASYIENTIIKKLTRYDVKIERVTSTRMNRILKTKDNICVANRAKTRACNRFCVTASFK